MAGWGTSGMTDATGGGLDRPGYLIVLRHVVVAQDIAQTIADRDPGARVWRWATSAAWPWPSWPSHPARISTRNWHEASPRAAGASC
jgi:hypothetical protein